jgi:hypothetical protein
MVGISLRHNAISGLEFSLSLAALYEGTDVAACAERS